MTVEETPIKGTKKEEKSSKTRKTKRKSTIKDANVEQNGFQRRIAGLHNGNDDRDSVTTSPDSAKIEDEQKCEKNQKKSSRKKRARNGGSSRKNGKSKSSRSETSDNKSKNSSEVNDQATSSDSGTHTDDFNATFVEISGFPSVSLIFKAQNIIFLSGVSRSPDW